MTAKELADTLTTIADQAKALRDAGIVGRVAIGDVSFELGEPLSPQVSATQDDHSGDPLNDPDTFGGHVPQRRVRNEEPASTVSDDD